MSRKANTLRDLITRKGINIKLKASAEDPNLLQLRSEFRDEFEANLPRALRFLKEKQLSEEDIYRITAMIGELGNNSFDHNLGKWPNGFTGNLIVLRYNAKEKLLEIVVIDLGVGFQESLKQNDPTPTSEVEAIKMGLAGVTGRVGETRGNGLRTVVSWLREHYDGKMRIQSNDGAVVVTTEEIAPIRDSNIKKITGTEIYLQLKP